MASIAIYSQDTLGLVLVAAISAGEGWSVLEYLQIRSLLCQTLGFSHQRQPFVLSSYPTSEHTDVYSSKSHLAVSGNVLYPSISSGPQSSMI
jgi:hypothetical protein